MGTLALAVVAVWIAWLLYDDVRKRGSVSHGTWVVVAWAVLYGSRPVTSWFDPHGVATAERHDEGTQSEALVHLSLIVAGLIVLVRRRISVTTVIRENRWLLVFYLFWAMSLLWSDLPFVTAKRLFKDLGNVVMVLVILTARDPGETVKAVFLRCAHVCIPLSIVLIRYYPELGRAYAGYSQSEVMYVGVTTHKNALGTLALAAALCLLWDLLDHRKAWGSGTGRWGLVAGVPLLAMCWALLLTIDSATALICATFGSALLIALRMPWAQRNPSRFEGYSLVAGLGLVALDWSVGLRETILLMLDRDTTLTTRTDIWPLLLKYQQDPVVGAGFNTFWSGDRLVQLWQHDLVAGLLQAHNGYVETYLNGGVVGVVLLVGLLIAGYGRIRTGLRVGASGAAFACAVLLVAVVYNASEASFNKLNLLWFATLFAVMSHWSAPKAEPTAAMERPRARATTGRP
jgi:O-antigen ligase